MAIQAGGVDIKLLSSDSRLYRLGIIHFSSTVEFRACLDVEIVKINFYVLFYLCDVWC